VGLVFSSSFFCLQVLAKPNRTPYNLSFSLELL
jgi:hypothetical protein